jgi:4-amino-4-deoxy-L-arabinose transferase-like glycosyltransferase
MDRTMKILLLFAGIIIFASFLRLYHITTTPPGLYPDEAADGNSALQVIQTRHFQVFYTGDNGREGLYVNTLVFFIKIFGNKPWVVRLPAAITGILTVVGIYFLGAELFGAETGLLAAFLLAACFWHIDLSRVGLRAIMSPLFVVWSLFVLLRALRTSRPWRGMPLVTIAGVLFAAGFFTYIAYRIMPLSCCSSSRS